MIFNRTNKQIIHAIQLVESIQGNGNDRVLRSSINTEWFRDLRHDRNGECLEAFAIDVVNNYSLPSNAVAPIHKYNRVLV